MSDVLRFTLYGNLRSKANSRKLATIGGRTRFIKSQDALDFEAQALLQITGKYRVGWTGPVRLEADIYYDSRRPDLDVSLLQDVLEHAGVYKNDRQIVELLARKFIDKHHPRCEVTLMLLDDVS